MSNLTIADARAREASLYAVVTRADGTTEDMGMIAYYHKNPVLCWIVNAFIAVRRYITAR